MVNMLRFRLFYKAIQITYLIIPCNAVNATYSSIYFI